MSVDAMNPAYPHCASDMCIQFRGLQVQRVTQECTTDYMLGLSYGRTMNRFPCPTRYPKDPCIQMMPTLGPKVCKYHLHWATRIPRATESGMSVASKTAGP